MSDHQLSLEEKLAYFEYNHGQLDSVVRELFDRIIVLEKEVKRLREQMQAGDVVRPAEEEEPPPHY